jgi:ribosomal protein L13E
MYYGYKIQIFFYSLVLLIIGNMKARINKPMVKRRIRGASFIRNGRGFSKSELKEAGIINLSIAKNNGIPVDLLRKTKNQENVEQLALISKDLLNLRKTVKKISTKTYGKTTLLDQFINSSTY